MSQDCDITATVPQHKRISLLGMPKKITHFPALAAVSVFALVGCAQAPAPSAPPAEPTTAPASVLPAVPGYAVGEMPPVPLFTLPDLALLEESLAGFAVEVADVVGDYPGLTVQPARCDEAGIVQSADSAVYLYGDGSVSYSGPDGTIQNFGDGSGAYVIDGVAVQVMGDGSGMYSSDDVSIINFGDGSGTYANDDVQISVNGDGSGAFSSDDESIQNFGDGSGSYSGGDTTIHNNGDGSGTYSDGNVTLQNFGDGSGTINGVSTDLDPVPPVPPLGKFPPMGALEPMTSCGTTITLDASVLFDFDKFDVRPAAAEVLDSLAQAMGELGVTSAVISGHTDALGSDGYNQTLSERRAASVVDALRQRGASAELSAVGFGESRPVAPNTDASGSDNPAGRQLNRRVEVFIPTV